MKRMGLFQRRADFSQDEFASHWMGPHARIADRMKRMSRYRQNHVAVETGDLRRPDGVSELWWETAEDMTIDFADMAFREALLEDERRFLRCISLLIVDEGELSGREGDTKVMLLSREPLDPTVARLIERTDGIVGVGRDEVVQSMSRDTLPPMTFVPSQIVSVHFGGSGTPPGAVVRFARQAADADCVAFEVTEFLVRGGGHHGSD